MSAAERQSPRAAIRSWLDKTKSNSTAVPNRAGDEPHGQSLKSRYCSRREKQGTNPSIENTGHDEHQVRLKRRRQGETHEAPECNTHSSIPPKSHGDEHARYRSKLQPSGSNFAEALGLHAPFRNFRDQVDDPDVNTNDPVRQRKRRRKASSTTSYLEPAAPDGFTDGDDGQQRPDYRLEPGKHTASEADDSCSSGSLQQTSLAIVSLQKPTKSYERRPRHKTREDRYELKEATSGKRKIVRENGEKKKEKKQKKHKRREKSGAALMHDFTAQNVSRDRLTLQPVKTLGLFGKGRASSPVKRKGLPDLAFSETAFLKSRRAQAGDPAAHQENRPPTKKSRKSTKGADTEAEISRYFISAKVPIRDATRPGEKTQQKEMQRRSMNYDSPPAFIDLPDKPFLGFGNCGVSVSPVKELDNQALKDLERRLTRSPTRSTSYFTWSQSGIRSQGSRHASLMPLETSRHSNLRRRSPTSAKPERPNLPVPSPKFPNISGGYRDAATTTTPLNRHCNGALDATATLVPLDDERCHLDSHSWEHHKTAEPEMDHNEQEPNSAEAVPVRETADKTTTITKEPRLRKQFSNNNIQPCIKLKLRDEELECNAQASVTRPGYSPAYLPSPDPLETMLENLLQENRYHSITDATPPMTDSSGRYDSMQAAAARPVRSPCTLPQRIDLHPHVDEASSPSLRLEYVASGFDVGRRAQQYQDTKPLGHKTQKSAEKMSRDRLSSSNRPTAIDHASDRLPNPDRSKVNSRNAWNGYNTIYENQQDAANAPLSESQTYKTEPNSVNNHIFTRSHSGGATSAYLIYEEEGHPIEMEGRSGEYVHDLYAGQNAVNNEHAYLEQGPLRDDMWVDRDQSEDIWATMEEPFLAERHHDHHSIGRGNSALEYDSAQDQREIQTGYQKSHQEHIAPEILEQRPLANQSRADYHPWLPEVISSFSIGRPRFRESTAVHNQQDDPALSGFWTPHKLY